MMRALLGRWSGAVALAMALSAGVGEAQESTAAEALEQSAELLEELRYEDARTVLMGAIRVGGIEAEELTAVYFNLGLVDAGLERSVEATDSFYMATLLNPSLLLPEGGSPRVRKYLDAARDRVAVVGALEARARVADGRVVVSVTNDPVSMVQRVRVVRSDSEGEETREVVEPARSGRKRFASVELGTAESVVVSLLDDSSNVVREFELEAGAEFASGGAEGGGSWLTSWGVWAGAAVALAAGGGYYIMEASSSQADIDDLRSTLDPDPVVVAGLQDDRDQAQLFGLAGLSLAGAAAVAAGVFFFDNPKPGSEESGELVFAPVVSQRGAGAQLRVSF